jgi:hypothetical protein
MQGLFDIVAQINEGLLAPLAEADRHQFVALLTRLVAADQEVKSPR